MSSPHAEVSQGERDANPHGQLNPNEQAGLERVAVIPHIELGHNPAQVLLKLVSAGNKVGINSGDRGAIKMPLVLLVQVTEPSETPETRRGV